MIKEKEYQLKSRLKEIIKEIGHKNEYKQKITSEFVDRNLSGSRGVLGASWVFNGNLDVNTLSDSEEDIRFLFLFSFALNKVVKDLNLNVEDYFTKLEIDKWINYKEDKTEDSIYPIVIQNVQEIVPGKIWQTVMSAQQVNKLDTANLFLYNFSNQRDPKITAAGERINIDLEKVAEIKDRMRKGLQYPDHIKLNVLHNMEDKVVYNPKNNTLTIYEGSVINIFDGYHRKTANALILSEIPDLIFNWPITFTNMSEKDAHDYMVQIDKQKPIKKEFIQSKDYSKEENLTIDVIMDDRLSELAKVIKDTDGYVQHNQALTTKTIIADAINDKFSEQIRTGSSGIRNVGKWIVEVTDYLIGLYVDEFVNNPYKVKETSYINNKNMFYGYIALAAKIQDDPNWKDILKQKMDSIDFSKNNVMWKDIGIIGDNNIKKPTKQKIYNLFERGI